MNRATAGDVYNVNIQAIDTRSAAQWARANPDVFVKGIGAAGRALKLSPESLAR